MLSDRLQPADFLLLDPQLCVLNKPRGIPTQARPGLAGVGAYELALQALDVQQLWPVHFLDRVTSGVLVLARTQEAARHLSAQFQDRQLRKTYLAWVEGQPPAVSGRIDLPLTREGGRPRVDLQQGKPASTRWRVLGTSEAMGAIRSLLYLRPWTGRTHQLRVHLAALGCPIVGDPIHGRGTEQDDCLLHALELRLQHPLDGRALRLRAPLRDRFPSLAGDGGLLRFDKLLG